MIQGCLGELINLRVHLFNEGKKLITAKLCNNSTFLFILVSKVNLDPSDNEFLINIPR